MKWEIRFHGTGIRLYDDGHAWDACGFDIKYEEFPGEDAIRSMLEFGTDSGAVTRCI